jgi:hypothetical protein
VGHGDRPLPARPRRELGITFYGLHGHDQLIAPAVDASGPRIVDFKSIAYDLPILEYRPYRAFSTNQSSSVVVQLFTGRRAAVGLHGLPAGAPTPDLRTVWSVGCALCSIGATIRESDVTEGHDGERLTRQRTRARCAWRPRPERRLPWPPSQRSLALAACAQKPLIPYSPTRRRWRSCPPPRPGCRTSERAFARSTAPC